MDERNVIRTGGVLLIAGTVTFVIVSLWLGRHFDYPGLLEGGAADVLPAVLIGGPTMRGVWSLYSLLPLVFIPASVATYYALRDTAPATMLLGMVFGSLSAPMLSIGLMSWPSINWELAQVWLTASPAVRESIAALFNGYNTYLCTYIGGLLGELSFSIWFILAGSAMVRSTRMPSWTGWASIVCGSLFILGAFHHTSGVLAIRLVSAVNIVVLPVWLVVLGAVLIVYGGASDGQREAAHLPDSGEPSAAGN